MQILYNPQDYFALVSNTLTADFCAPLFKNTPITEFDYGRYYDDFSYFTIGSDPKFESTYIDLKIQPTFYEIDYYNQPFAYFAPSVLPPLDAAKFIANTQLGCDFNIHNRFYIITKFTDYYETCGFGASDSINISISTLILNQLDLFKQYICYFREKAANYITVLSNNRIAQPRTEIPPIIENNNFKNFNLTDFKKETLLNSYSILVNGIPKSLTQREMECLRLLKNNVTSKTIANRLEISNRTVDFHLTNIKSKLNCHFESELIKIAQENNLF